MGLNVPLGETVSLWPTASIGAWHVHSTLTSPRNGYQSYVDGTVVAVNTRTEVDESTVVTELFAPILVHPARHFFVGLGPGSCIRTCPYSVGELTNRRAFIGLSSTLGGWF